MILEPRSVWAFVELGKALARSLPQVFLDPGYAFLFWVVALVVSTQYRRVAATEHKLYGAVKNSVYRQMLSALAYGVLGGLFGSAVMVIIGVSVNRAGVAYLWPVALLLFLVNPRFMCFAYAGGLVSLVSVLVGWPPVYIPGLMGLVAVLHITESFLIGLSGATCVTPLLVKNRRGTVVPGYSLQKYWPIPIMVLIALNLADLSQIPGLISMPDWWPLIRPEIEVPEGTHLLYTMVPVVAALGYGDLAVTVDPREKSIRSAKALGLYSAGLLALSVLSSRVRGLQVLAALFSPLGHELVVRLGIRGELEGSPRVEANGRGAVILDVFQGSEAARAGFRARDVITHVEGRPVSSAEDVASVLRWVGHWGDAAGGVTAEGLTPAATFWVKRGNKTLNLTLTGRAAKDLLKAGIVLVPPAKEGPHVSVGHAPPFRQIWDRIQRLARKGGRSNLLL